MIAIKCDRHGFMVLSKSQFQEQMKDEGRWRCPICDSEFEAIDVRIDFTINMCNGCGQSMLGEDLKPKRSVVYNKDRVAFFCDKLCESGYEGRLAEQRRKQKEMAEGRKARKVMRQASMETGDGNGR